MNYYAARARARAHARTCTRTVYAAPRRSLIYTNLCIREVFSEEEAETWEDRHFKRKILLA